MKEKPFLNINIMAHPKRKGYMTYLKKQLGGKVTIVWDKIDSVWDTRKRCLEQHIKVGAKWSLTLQDDCLLTDDFIAKVEKFIKHHDRPKRRVYAFNFYFWSRDNGLANMAMRHGYYRGRGMKSGLAICLKTNIIPELLEMWPDDNTTLIRHDDSRIGRFLRKRQIRTVYPAPSLVQHRDDASLIYQPGEMPEKRQALYYDGKK